MPKFDENLFGRIAVLNAYVTKDELEKCAEICRGSASGRHVGHVLLERGLISQEQFDRILEIRDKKVRKLLRSQEEGRRNDREFGDLVAHLGRVDLNTLESAVLEQQRLRQLNLHFGLAEVLVAREVLTPKEVQRLYAILGRSMLRCCYCDVQFQVVEIQEGATYHCPRCQAVLEQPVYLDPLLVAGVLDSQVANEPLETKECVGTDG